MTNDWERMTEDWPGRIAMGPASIESFVMSRWFSVISIGKAFHREDRDSSLRQ